MKRLLKKLILSEYLVLFLCLAYFLCLSPFVPRMASLENVFNILSDMAPVLVVAGGLTLVLISGGIDLSMTSNIALCSVAGGMVMSGDNGLLAGHPLATPLGLLAMLSLGSLVGALNGLAVTQIRVPPFIATLTTMMFVSGLAIWITQSQKIYALPESFTLWGQGTPFGEGRDRLNAPIRPAAIAVGCALALHFLLKSSLYGRWLYALGHNEKAAHISGVPVQGTLMLTYVLCGLFCAVSSVLLTGQMETGDPVMGRHILLDIIGATVIGGASLYGGKGKMIGTVFGVLLLAMIANSLNLMGLSYFFITMVKGAVILAAALLDSFRNKLLAA